MDSHTDILTHKCSNVSLCCRNRNLIKWFIVWNENSFIFREMLICLHCDCWKIWRMLKYIISSDRGLVCQVKVYYIISYNKKFCHNDHTHYIVATLFACMYAIYQASAWNLLEPTLYKYLQVFHTLQWPDWSQSVLPTPGDPSSHSECLSTDQHLRRWGGVLCCLSDKPGVSCFLSD